MFRCVIIWLIWLEHKRYFALNEVFSRTLLKGLSSSSDPHAMMPLEVSVTQLPPACQLCEHIPCQCGTVGARCLFACHGGDQTSGPPWSDRPATLMTSSAWDPRRLWKRHSSRSKVKKEQSGAPRPPPAVLSDHDTVAAAYKLWGREHQAGRGAHSVQSMMGNERQHQPGSWPYEPTRAPCRERRVVMRQT